MRRLRSETDSRWIRRVATSAAVLSCCGLAATAHAAPTVRVVTKTGEPSAFPNLTYTPLGSPIINDQGDVLFISWLTNPSGTHDSMGLFLDNGESITLIHRTGTQMPQQPEGVLFQNFGIGYGAPALNNAGQISFTTGLNGAGIFLFYLHTNGNTTKVAQGGDPAPGFPSNWLYGNDLFPAGYVFDDTGALAFRGEGWLGTTRKKAIFRGTAGAVVPVAIDGDPAPVLGSPYTFATQDDRLPASAGGNIVFAGRLTGPDIEPYVNDAALYAGSPSSPTLIATGQAPGTEPDKTFYEFTAVGISDNGQQLATFAWPFGPTSTGVDFNTLYTAPIAGPISLTVRGGWPVPGVPGFTFGSYEFDKAPSISNSGYTATKWRIINGDEGHDALIYAKPGDIRLIAQAGQAAPGMPAGSVFTYFGTVPEINNHDQVLFTAGVFVNEEVPDYSTVWLWDQTNGLQLLASNNYPLTLAPGDTRTVSYAAPINLSSQQNPQCSTRQALNDRGEIAMEVFFTDNSRAHLVLTVPPIVACPADFNGDGTRDVADLFAYINAWLAKTANADFNDDSSVDVADLFAYINAWLAGC